MRGKGGAWQGGMCGRGACMADTRRYGQRAGNTHPTGMYSCQKMLAQHFYRMPTKLLEGNVFSHVCLSVILFTGEGSPTLYKAPSPAPRDMFNLDLTI